MKTIKLGTRQHRDFTFEVEATEEGPLDISFSSEYPVLRDFGYEVLSHAPGAMDMSRADGLPFLVDHCTDEAECLIGICSNLRIENGKGRCAVEFSDNNEVALMVEADIKQGLRKNISFGYMINSYTVTKSADPSTPDTVLVTSWTPYEISSVTVPADMTVGISRSLEVEEPVVEAKHEVSEAGQEQVTSQIFTEVEKSEEVMIDQRSLNQPTKETHTMNRNEILTLKAFADKLGLGQEASEMLASERSLDEIRMELMTLANSKVVPTQAGNSYAAKEIESYDLGRAMKGLLDKSVRGFEWEVSQDLARKLGKSGAGLYIPTNVRANELATTQKGGSLVFDKYMGFIEYLRNQSKVLAMGAGRMNGSGGTLSWVRQKGTATGSWRGELGTPSNSSADFEVLTMTPKAYTVLSPYTRELFLTSPENIQSVIANDLAQLHGVGIDLAMIAGTGSPQPVGILGTTGINDCNFSVAGNTATAPTFALINNIKAQISKAGVDTSNLKYLTTPEGFAKLETVQKATSTSSFLVENKKFNGYEIYESGNVPIATTKHTIIGGKWDELVLVDFGALELIVDELTLAERGLVRVISNQYVDVLCKQPKAFGRAIDMLTT